MLKTMLIGNLGNDPEMRYSASGQPYLRFNVASNYRTRTPEGEWQEKTEWVRVTLTGTRAESLSPYLKKGSRVYVDGRLEGRPWTDQQGQVRAGLEVMANEVQFMSSRSDDERAGSGGQEGGAPRIGRPPRAHQLHGRLIPRAHRGVPSRRTRESLKTCPSRRGAPTTVRVPLGPLVVTGLAVVPGPAPTL
jgi:single-strand DNA-binding protein